MMANWIVPERGRGARVPLGQLGLGLALVALVLVLGKVALSADAPGPQNCVAGPHSGVITVSQEWCLIDSPHLVNGAVTVAAGVTLTVESGVEILSSPGSGSLYVYGTLLAEGTPSLPITLTAQSGNWAGSQAATGSRLRLAYCDLDHAGGDSSHYGL